MSNRIRDSIFLYKNLSLYIFFNLCENQHLSPYEGLEYGPSDVGPLGRQSTGNSPKMLNPWGHNESPRFRWKYGFTDAFFSSLIPDQNTQCQQTACINQSAAQSTGSGSRGCKL